MPARFDIIASPIGPLLVGANENGLARIDMLDDERVPAFAAGWTRDSRAVADATDQLHGYFAGSRTAFDLPLAPHGTPFQLTVWRALAEIPFGVTMTYGELARRIGCAGGARAVGAANGANPIAIVVPCHRVCGADGSLTGFGGGLHRKRWLIEHERRFAPAGVGLARA